MMGFAANAASARDRLAQLRTARERTQSRQKALRPQIREAKQRGEEQQANALLDELRALRVQLRRLQEEERALRGQRAEQ